jgi:hypothetical protein
VNIKPVVEDQMGLLDFKKDQFSQNGEDGILERVFDLIGTETATCCEFGAWDGFHLSNTRKLLIAGWSGLLIEADPQRFRRLRDNYSGNERVKRACQFINGADELDRALSQNGFLAPLDLLVIDIDGLDYYIFEELKIRPRLICVEVNAGHSPRSGVLLARDIAARDIGQPLSAFCNVGKRLGYRLICFNSNAFFLRNDITNPLLEELDPVEAYAEFLGALDKKGRRWMYLVNKGLVHPFFRFRNECLSADRLELGPLDRSATIAKGLMWRSRGLLSRTP